VPTSRPFDDSAVANRVAPPNKALQLPSASSFSRYRRFGSLR